MRIIFFLVFCFSLILADNGEDSDESDETTTTTTSTTTTAPPRPQEHFIIKYRKGGIQPAEEPIISVQCNPDEKEEATIRYLDIVKLDETASFELEIKDEFLAFVESEPAAAASNGNPSALAKYHCPVDYFDALQEVLSLFDSERAALMMTTTSTPTPETDKTTVAPETDKTTVAPETDKTTVAPETDKTTVAPETDKTTVAPETDKTTVAPETDKTTVAPETDKTTVAPETDAPETDAPETDAPETDAPETDAPETDAPETDAPETDAPETDAPETDAPETDAPETDAPETDAPETDAPETDAPETDAPETDAPETDAPETDAPETDAPETDAPETDAPETDAPETDAPETDAPETDAPETDAPETDAPETDAPETDAPETDAPETDAPETDAPETDAPETDAPETDAPETDAPETDAPETDAPETDAPETDAPETDAPETDAPETDAPETDAPETDAPETDAPETDAPETDAPETDAPETDAPETDAPETDAPEADASETDNVEAGSIYRSGKVAVPKGPMGPLDPDVIKQHLLSKKRTLDENKKSSNMIRMKRAVDDGKRKLTVLYLGSETTKFHDQSLKADLKTILIGVFNALVTEYDATDDQDKSSFKPYEVWVQKAAQDETKYEPADDADQQKNYSPVKIHFSAKHGNSKVDFFVNADHKIQKSYIREYDMYSDMPEIIHEMVEFDGTNPLYKAIEEHKITDIFELNGKLTLVTELFDILQQDLNAADKEFVKLETGPKHALNVTVEKHIWQDFKDSKEKRLTIIPLPDKDTTKFDHKYFVVFMGRWMYLMQNNLELAANSWPVKLRVPFGDIGGGWMFINETFAAKVTTPSQRKFEYSRQPEYINMTPYCIDSAYWLLKPKEPSFSSTTEWIPTGVLRVQFRNKYVDYDWRNDKFFGQEDSSDPTVLATKSLVTVPGLFAPAFKNLRCLGDEKFKEGAWLKTLTDKLDPAAAASDDRLRKEGKRILVTTFPLRQPHLKKDEKYFGDEDTDTIKLDVVNTCFMKKTKQFVELIKKVVE